MNIKEKLKLAVNVLSRPKTIAALQIVVAAMTLVEAVKRLKKASRDEQ